MAALFDSFLGELQKTFGGGPSTEDMGRFQTGAIAGGKRVLGISDLLDTTGVPLTPEQLMSTDGGELMSVMPPIEAAPTLASLEEPGAAPTPLGKAPVKKSSRAKHADAEVAPTADAKKGTDAPAVDMSTWKPTKEDPIAKLLEGRRGKYGEEQSKALADAKSQEQMTDDDKLVYALLGALPGLIGLVGGAAAGGGQGAAAGLAGGLTGGASGMQMIADAKNSKRKEALARADKAGDRMGRIDDQELARSEQVAGQQFSAEQADKSRTFSAGQSDKELQFRGTQSEKELAARAKEGANNRANALQLKRMDIFGDAQRAGIAAAAKAKEVHTELKDFQGKATQFATSMLLSKDDLDKMQDPTVWNTMSTWNGLQSALSDPRRQKYARAAFNFIDAVTRDVSGAAITPDEWQTKFKQYLPSLNSSPDDIKYAKQFRDGALSTMLSKAGPGRDIAIQSYQEATGAGQPPTKPAATPGQRVRQNGHVYEQQPDGSYKAVE